MIARTTRLIGKIILTISKLAFTWAILTLRSLKIAMTVLPFVLILTAIFEGGIVSTYFFSSVLTFTMPASIAAFQAALPTTIFGILNIAALYSAFSLYFAAIIGASRIIIAPLMPSRANIFDAATNVMIHDDDRVLSAYGLSDRALQYNNNLSYWQTLLITNGGYLPVIAMMEIRAATYNKESVLEFTAALFTGTIKALRNLAINTISTAFNALRHNLTLKNLYTPDDNESHSEPSINMRQAEVNSIPVHHTTQLETYAPTMTRQLEMSTAGDNRFEQARENVSTAQGPATRSGLRAETPPL